jgi:uncharacterized protein
MDYLTSGQLSGGIRIAGLYGAVIVLMGVVLTVLVVLQRRSKLIGIGDGGDRTIARMIRVHGNFAENAPFALALLILLALSGAVGLVLHAVGLLFLVGRVLHAFGLSKTAGSSIGRVLGMVLTFTAFIVGAVSLLIIGL